MHFSESNWSQLLIKHLKVTEFENIISHPSHGWSFRISNERECLKTKNFKGRCGAKFPDGWRRTEKYAMARIWILF